MCPLVIVRKDEGSIGSGPHIIPRLLSCDDLYIHDTFLHTMEFRWMRLPLSSTIGRLRDGSYLVHAITFLEKPFIFTPSFEDQVRYDGSCLEIAFESRWYPRPLLTSLKLVTDASTFLGDHRLWTSRSYSCHLSCSSQPRTGSLRRIHG